MFAFLAGIAFLIGAFLVIVGVISSVLQLALVLFISLALWCFHIAFPIAIHRQQRR